jgi:hypothetical protein
VTQVTLKFAALLPDMFSVAKTPEPNLIIFQQEVYTVLLGLVLFLQIQTEFDRANVAGRVVITCKG